MADIFDEVEEDLRRDRLKKVWDRFAPLIIGGAVLIVVGIGGWRVYQYFQAERAAADGARYLAAMNLSGEGKHAEAAAAFAALAQDGTAGYRTVARLRAAAELAGTDPKAAIAAYDAYAGDNTEPAGLRDVARLRTGYLLVDNGTYDEVRRRVEPLAVPASPFRHGAREVLGLSAFKSGDWAEARRWFEALVSDAQTPPTVRQRADLLLDVIGAANAPPPVSPPPPAPAAIDMLIPPGGSQTLPSLTAPTIPVLPSGETTPSFDAPATPPAAGETASPTPATPEAAPAAPESAPATPPAAAAPEATTPPVPPTVDSPAAAPAPEPPPAPAPAVEAAPQAAPPAAPAESPPVPAAPEASPAPAAPSPAPAEPAAPPAGGSTPAPPQAAPATPDGSTPPATAGSTTDAAPATPPPASSSESPQ